jgi:hypothetical protein
MSGQGAAVVAASIVGILAAAVIVGSVDIAVGLGLDLDGGVDAAFVCGP